MFNSFVAQLRHIAGSIPKLKKRKVQSSEYQHRFTLEFAISKHLSYINAKSACLKQVFISKTKLVHK